MNKQFSDMKTNFLQQIKTQEMESKQKLEAAKMQNDETVRKLEQEKVNSFLNFL